jgi:hypothetical protein
MFIDGSSMFSSMFYSHLQVKLTILKVEPADGCLSNLEKKLEKVLEMLGYICERVPNASETKNKRFESHFSDIA